MPEPTVYFIGAGPGAADLITLRGKAILERADVVIWADSLVNPEVLGWARPNANVHASSAMTLEEQVAVMVAAASAGRVVARLHTGDPAFYGAINEQMRALDAAGVTYAIVPGVSSVSAAAAALGTELTAPEVSQTVILTRAAGRTPVPAAEALSGLAGHQATLVLFLSAGLAERAVADLIAGGYPPETPAAVVYRASWPDEMIVRVPLAELPGALRAAGISRQALILVGQALAAPEKSSLLYDPGFSHGWRGQEG